MDPSEIEARINSPLGRKIRSRVDRLLARGYQLLNQKSSRYPWPIAGPQTNEYSGGCLVGLLTEACFGGRFQHLETPQVADALKVSPATVLDLEEGFEDWAPETGDPETFKLGRALALHYGLL